jgi:putative heme iron utilization protein
MALPTRNENPDRMHGFSARRLLRSARVGTLATSADGAPFASLVTPAAAADGSVLLLLSDLAEHTRHLNAEARCSVLVAGPAAEVNPQTAPRLTLTGIAEPTSDPALRTRYLAVHPYAALYAGFGDFRLWRVRPGSGRLVEGFARAFTLQPAQLAPPADAVAALLAAEAAIMAHCNRDHRATLARIAGSPGDWRMVAMDADGCDLALAERVLRVAWSAPASSADDVRRELVRLSRGQ